MPPKKQKPEAKEQASPEKEEPIKLWPPVDKGVIIGPNGVNHYVEPEFNLPDGFVAWCFICGRPPFNKTTKIGDLDVLGVGFKTMNESIRHQEKEHDYRKIKTIG